MTKMWQFREIAAIEEANFNNVLERFYNLGIDGLVRENIQNSLDGKLKYNEEPVLVTIAIGTMNPDDVPGIEEIKEHAVNLIGGNEYDKETIKHIKDSLSKNPVQYISFEDENTIGLTGAEFGDDVSKKGTWGAYAYQKGLHPDAEDATVEKTRGGSHGVGKIACNAGSDLHVMFFANCDENGKQHIGGTVQFVEHRIADKCYRATGYFSDRTGDHLFPFENNFGQVFEKTTRGLKIVIPYLREQYNHPQSLLKAVCDNFFVAILDNKLKVIVDGVEVSKDTIEGIVNNPEIYMLEDLDKSKPNLTPLYVKNYTKIAKEEITVSDISKEYGFNLYFIYDKDIKRGRTAIVRGIGMKIEDMKIKGYVNAPYNAVLIPKGAEEDAFLKTLENESHTSISGEQIKDPHIQRNAKRFINNVNKKMQEFIASKLEEANPTEGKIDTAELIYSVEHSFKKDLERSTPTVTVSTGTGSVTVVNTGGKQPKKKGEKRDKREKKERQKRRKQTQRRIANPGDRPRNTYTMAHESVKRAVLANKEILRLDFTDMEECRLKNRCDISLFQINGDGSVESNKLPISDNYAAVKDSKTGEFYPIVNNTIKDIAIVDGKVQIELTTNGRFNTALKFMYSVEV